MIQLPQFAQAHHLEGTITEDVLPFHRTGSVVTRRSNYTQAPGANHDLPATRYTVLAIVYFTFTESGVDYYQGRLDNFPATCADFPYSPNTDQLNDPTTPFFYILRRIGDGKIFGVDPAAKVHETDCLPDGVVQQYIQDNITDWWVI